MKNVSRSEIHDRERFRSDILTNMNNLRQFVQDQVELNKEIDYLNSSSKKNSHQNHKNSQIYNKSEISPNPSRKSHYGSFFNSRIDPLNQIDTRFPTTPDSQLRYTYSEKPKSKYKKFKTKKDQTLSEISSIISPINYHTKIRKKKKINYNPNFDSKNAQVYPNNIDNCDDIYRYDAKDKIKVQNFNDFRNFQLKSLYFDVWNNKWKRKNIKKIKTDLDYFIELNKTLKQKDQIIPEEEVAREVNKLRKQKEKLNQSRFLNYNSTNFSDSSEDSSLNQMIQFVQSQSSLESNSSIEKELQTPPIYDSQNESDGPPLFMRNRLSYYKPKTRKNNVNDEKYDPPLFFEDSSENERFFAAINCNANLMEQENYNEIINQNKNIKNESNNLTKFNSSSDVNFSEKIQSEKSENTQKEKNNRIVDSISTKNRKKIDKTTTEEEDADDYFLSSKISANENKIIEKEEEEDNTSNSLEKNSSYENDKKINNSDTKTKKIEEESNEIISKSKEESEKQSEENSETINKSSKESEKQSKENSEIINKSKEESEKQSEENSETINKSSKESEKQSKENSEAIKSKEESEKSNMFIESDKKEHPLKDVSSKSSSKSEHLIKLPSSGEDFFLNDYEDNPHISSSNSELNSKLQKNRRKRKSTENEEDQNEYYSSQLFNSEEIADESQPFDEITISELYENENEQANNSNEEEEIDKKVEKQIIFEEEEEEKSDAFLQKEENLNEQQSIISTKGEEEESKEFKKNQQSIPSTMEVEKEISLTNEQKINLNHKNITFKEEESENQIHDELNSAKESKHLNSIKENNYSSQSDVKEQNDNENLSSESDKQKHYSNKNYSSKSKPKQNINKENSYSSQSDEQKLNNFKPYSSQLEKFNKNMHKDEEEDFFSFGGQSNFQNSNFSQSELQKQNNCKNLSSESKKQKQYTNYDYSSQSDMQYQKKYPSKLERLNKNKYKTSSFEEEEEIESLSENKTFSFEEEEEELDEEDVYFNDSEKLFSAGHRIIHNSEKPIFTSIYDENKFNEKTEVKPLSKEQSRIIFGRLVDFYDSDKSDDYDDKNEFSTIEKTTNWSKRFDSSTEKSYEVFEIPNRRRIKHSSSDDAIVIHIHDPEYDQ